MSRYVETDDDIRREIEKQVYGKYDPDDGIRNAYYKNDEFLCQLFAGGNFIMFSRYFLAVMSADEALLLAYLMNVFAATMKNKKRQRKKGWAYRHMKTVMRQLFMSKSKQTRLFRSLEKKRFITTVREGYPAVRFFKINTSFLFHSIAEIVDIHQEAKRKERKTDK